MVCIVGVGGATIDHTILVSQFPEEDSKIGANGTRESGGGNCANALVTLARLGATCRCVSVVGDDRRGRRIVEELEEEGVEVRWIHELSGPSTMVYVLVSQSSGSRTVISHRGFSYDIEFSTDVSVLEGADYLFIDGRFHNIAGALVREAKKKTISIALELERLDLKVDRFIPDATIVFVSRRFHTEYFNSDNLEVNLRKVLDAGPRIAVTTLGAEGALVGTKEDGVFFVPAAQVRVRDTTGAGDVFHSAFLFGLIKGATPQVAAKFASWLAGRKCEGYGARAPLPQRAWQEYQSSQSTRSE